MQWGQLPVYLVAELSAGVVAALAYVLVSRTRRPAAATTGPADSRVAA